MSWRAIKGRCDSSDTRTVLSHLLQICGIVITRPSYHGVGCSSSVLRSVVDLCHQFSAPVIVDEAHGAHIHLLDSPSFGNALQCGADIVIQSSHKTLTSLSQTAMMHLNRCAFKYFSEGSIERATQVLDRSYSMLTTTSPNSLLLASLDGARAHIQESGKTSMINALQAVGDIKDLCRNHPTKVAILEDSKVLADLGLHVDPLRLTLRFMMSNNQHLDDILCSEHGIFCELNLKSCISYHISLFSTKATLKALAAALKDVCDNWCYDQGAID